MEQKDYKFEIVNVLVNGCKHIREISRILGVNHMMVVRKIKELFVQNVVDYNRNGRNNNYFLKDSPEAKAYILMSENYKLIKILLKHNFLRDVVSKMQKDNRINFACIFGSYAKGLENKDSDVDIYLNTDDLKIKKEYSKLDSKFSIKIGKWEKNNFLVREIIENHILIKGGEIYHEKFFD